MNTQEESSHNNIISILPSGEEKPGSSSVFRQLGKSEAVLSCLCYGLSSMSVTLMNKLIFSGEGRQFPISCIVVQNAISTLFLALCTLLGLLSSSKLSLQLLRRLFVPQLFSSLYLYSNAKAFEYLTIPVVTSLKALVPICTKLLERFLFGDVVSTLEYFSMILIFLSSAVTAHFDVSSTQGYFWTGVSIVSNVLWLASLRFFIGKTRYSNIAKAMNGNLLSFIVLTPFAWIQKEPQQIYYDWSQLSSVFKASFTFSGVAVTVIQISVFWVNATTSGATFSFVGNFIKVPTIIIGTIFFHEKLPFMAWVGVIMGILSGFLFSLSKYLQVPILMRTSSSNFNLDSHSPGSSLTKTERSN
ncbi:nucleotide-sugar transporter, DMT family [Galdieria sulphuraria]|uniref:Nucleotide-sugar transporter, DMT family n=1 Tax=Galdieria sulphuraria TaxID=130081 RepID=M2X270_GALSU|nr:nucleotide-sugar transporter, DMT family [Galdieria sulphuraria]EME30470.1 nucleotide-sugar transporter, DMT family [Galdieria sulphuraria]|eukprot:XP_005706990.1 nucleotide-sugar transporter, DMT family [Galdieria sulphuraria]